jgi:hypothetical protein
MNTISKTHRNRSKFGMTSIARTITSQTSLEKDGGDITMGLEGCYPPRSGVSRPHVRRDNSVPSVWKLGIPLEHPQGSQSGVREAAITVRTWASKKGPSRIGVEKSSSHHLSQIEIASDNPCSQHLFRRCLRLSKRRQNLRIMIVLRENAIPWNVSFSAKLSTTTILLSPVIRHHPMCTESLTSEVADKLIKPSSWSA